MVCGLAVQSSYWDMIDNVCTNVAVLISCVSGLLYYCVCVCITVHELMCTPGHVVVV